MIIAKAQRKHVLLALCEAKENELTVIVDSTGRMSVKLPDAAIAELRELQGWIDDESRPLVPGSARDAYREGCTCEFCMAYRRFEAIRTPKTSASELGRRDG